MTFLQFQKELYYISEGIIFKNSQKDLRRCEGFQKVLYSARNNSSQKSFESLIDLDIPLSTAVLQNFIMLKVKKL